MTAQAGGLAVHRAGRTPSEASAPFNMQIAWRHFGSLAAAAECIIRLPPWQDYSGIPTLNPLFRRGHLGCTRTVQ